MSQVILTYCRGNIHSRYVWTTEPFHADPTWKSKVLCERTIEDTGPSFIRKFEDSLKQWVVGPLGKGLPSSHFMAVIDANTKGQGIRSTLYYSPSSTTS